MLKLSLHFNNIGIFRFMKRLRAERLLLPGRHFTVQRNVIYLDSRIYKKRTNQQNAQINFGLINLLLFSQSNMFLPLNRIHHQGVQNP